MLSRIVSRIAMSAVWLAVPMLVLVSCEDEQPAPPLTPTTTPPLISGSTLTIKPTQVSVSAPTPTPVSTKTEINTSVLNDLTQVTPPCTPVSGTTVDPCDPDAPPFEMGGANYIPLLGDEPASIREMLDDDPLFPAWVTHLVLRGTYLPGTARCTAGDRFRPLAYLMDEFVYTANSRSFKCYVDIRANAYVVGSGPSTLTVMVFRYAYFDGEYASSAQDGQTEEDVIEEVKHQFETAINGFFPGREHVIFLGPPVAISSEVWRFMGYWDIQQTDGGTAIAIHPRRDIWASTRPDEYQTHRSKLEMALPAFTQAVTTAHQARVAEYGGRIGSDANLPKLVSNANQLRQYYTEVGAYAPGVPTPVSPPPLCGLAKSDQAGLLRDCKALLASKDTLRGTATLNWSADTAIASWDGVTVKGKPSRVAEIMLTEKSLDGTIPSELAELTGLQILHLYENQLTGPIPSEFGSLSALTDLRLYGNRLSGSIPTELGSLSNLRDLFLGDNQLSSTIPTQLGSLSNLRFLNLDSNRLTGGIPTQLGSLANLQDLSLSGNQLTGSVPTQLGDLTALRDLFLNDNQLTGSIPTQLGKLAALELLDLSGNGLTGSVPTQLGKLSKLESLYLRNNALTGTIPTQLGSLSNLEILRLNGNTLTGCIPAALRDVDDHDLARLRLQYCPAPEA